MSAVYPGIDDWDALVRSYLPAPADIGVSGDFIQALCWPWSILEQGIQALAVGLVDLGAADAWVVEVAGARVNEPRGGLGDTELRRVVEGRRVAVGSLGTSAHVWAVLVALTGVQSGRLLVAENESTGETGVIMWGFIAFTPTESFLLRAGAVLRDALPLSAEANCTLGTAQTSIFDETAFDDGTLFGYSLPLE